MNASIFATPFAVACSWCGATVAGGVLTVWTGDDESPICSTCVRDAGLADLVESAEAARALSRAGRRFPPELTAALDRVLLAASSWTRSTLDARLEDLAARAAARRRPGNRPPAGVRDG